LRWVRRMHALFDLAGPSPVAAMLFWPVCTLDNVLKT